MAALMLVAIGVCIGLATDRVIMAWQWTRLRRLRGRLGQLDDGDDRR